MTTISKIAWLAGPDGRPGKTWGPVLGCEPVSPGCDLCYAVRTSHRCAHLPYTRDLYAGLTVRPDGGPTAWTGVVRTVPDRLQDPFTWRKPTRVFVNSQSDLFHKDVPVEFIAAVFAVMAMTPQHTYQVLTKRHARMRAVLTSERFEGLVLAAMRDLVKRDWFPWSRPGHAREIAQRLSTSWFGTSLLPLPNVELCVSAENQTWADTRIPALLETPAAVRGVSLEPLIGPVDLHVGEWLHEPDCLRLDDCQCMPTQQHLDWVIIGCESGPGARPMDLAWAEKIVRDCRAAGTAVFVKQLPLGPNGRATEDIALFPEDLRIREYPMAVTS